MKNQMTISASPTKANLNGDTYEIGMSLTTIFHEIYAEYGLEAGQKVIDEAMNLAIKS